MKMAKSWLVVLIVVGLLIRGRPVRADIAPPPAPQLGGLEPFKYQETNVQMVYERVEMEVQPFFYSDYDYSFTGSRANVTAYFTMHNNGDSPETMQVIFPLESFSNCRMGYGGGNSYTNYFVQEDSFSAIVDGNEAPIQKVVTDHPDKIEGVCDQMSWAGFDVAFPVDEDIVIKVQYVMETMGRADSMQNIEYILETGAGWAGTIKRGYVVVKFPYTATTENVLAESTPGYQFLYNEIFWSFENLEPTSENNIQVSIVSPDIWQKVLSLRRGLKENPNLPENWLELAQSYEAISTWHGPNVRDTYFYQKIPSTYEEGIMLNPNNASLYSNYARFVFYDCCYYTDNMSTETLGRIINLINKALALDPQDSVALEVMGYIRSHKPDYTPPPTMPPTATSLFTVTPSTTPSATITSVPSETPMVVTVVHTKIVNAPTSTQELDPALTIFPSLTPSPIEPPRESNSSSMILIALGIFMVGAGSGWFLSKRQKK